MRLKRLTVIYFVISLILSQVTVFAEEAVSTDRIEIPTESPEAIDDEYEKRDPDVYAALQDEVELLSAMEPEVDYADGEGVFLAQSYEEALSVASEYSAELLSFEDGVARVAFHECTVDAYNSAVSSEGITKFIEPNLLFELDDIIEGPDPYAAKECGAYQYAHDKIHDTEAHEISDGGGIRIAVIDTGVNAEHEDLQGVVSVDYVSSVLPSFKDKRNAGKDYHGHGTHVCGVIAAIKNNGKGGYGVAPGVHIDSIQVSVTGSNFTLSDVALGVKKAIALNDNIITMSLGSDKNSSVLREVLDEAYSKGILCVAAAGNKGNTDKRYPAAEDNVIAVGATTINGALAYYSNYGDWVDIAAPGSTIYSTYLYSSSINKAVEKNRYSGVSANNSYGKLSGTSQAVPVVTGTAALIYASNPVFFKDKNADTVNFVRELIRYTSDGKDYYYDYDDRRVIHGLVRADKAVQYASNLKLSESYSVIDTGGHYGPLLSGFISKGKTIKLKIGSKDGIADKNLLKNAQWESTNPDKITVKKGKVKCTKKATAGDTAIISAKVGSETVYYAVTIQNTVKKMGVLDKKSYSFKSSYTMKAEKGVDIDISTPNSAVSSSLVSVGFSTKKKDLRTSEVDNTTLANGRYKYKVTIPKGTLKKISVKETDKNGDPKVINIQEACTVNIKYKLLDGSNKTFTLKLKVG
ncbi:MAG: S8 family serine peptidase [Lachnospiraceae bacterium]|nr:S8 family serine peptidase [Lachnospiraceae bacterium]